MWPAAIVAAALVVFAGRKPWAALLGWSIVLVMLAVLHPIAGDGSQARVLAVVQSLSIVAAAGVGYAWYRELERMGRRVDTATQANTGAQILAKNAIARAERAEAKASKPVVLIVAPANDGDFETETIKTL